MSRVEGGRGGGVPAPNREALKGGLDRQLAGLGNNPLLAVPNPATDGARLNLLQQLTSLLATRLSLEDTAAGRTTVIDSLFAGKSADAVANLCAHLEAAMASPHPEVGATLARHAEAARVGRGKDPDADRFDRNTARADFAWAAPDSQRFTSLTALEGTLMAAHGAFAGLDTDAKAKKLDELLAGKPVDRQAILALLVAYRFDRDADGEGRPVQILSRAAALSAPNKDLDVAYRELFTRLRGLFSGDERALFLAQTPSPPIFAAVRQAGLDAFDPTPSATSTAKAPYVPKDGQALADKAFEAAGAEGKALLRDLRAMRDTTLLADSAALLPGTFLHKLLEARRREVGSLARHHADGMAQLEGKLREVDQLVEAYRAGDPKSIDVYRARLAKAEALLATAERAWNDAAKAGGDQSEARSLYALATQLVRQEAAQVSAYEAAVQLRDELSAILAGGDGAQRALTLLGRGTELGARPCREDATTLAALADLEAGKTTPTAAERRGLEKTVLAASDQRAALLQELSTYSVELAEELARLEALVEAGEPAAVGVVESGILAALRQEKELVDAKVAGLMDGLAGDAKVLATFALWDVNEAIVDLGEARFLVTVGGKPASLSAEELLAKGLESTLGDADAKRLEALLSDASAARDNLVGELGRAAATLRDVGAPASAHELRDLWRAKALMGWSQAPAGVGRDGLDTLSIWRDRRDDQGRVVPGLARNVAATHGLELPEARPGEIVPPLGVQRLLALDQATTQLRRADTDLELRAIHGPAIGGMLRAGGENLGGLGAIDWTSEEGQRRGLALLLGPEHTNVGSAALDGLNLGEQLEAARRMLEQRAVFNRYAGKQGTGVLLTRLDAASFELAVTALAAKVGLDTESPAWRQSDLAVRAQRTLDAATRQEFAAWAALFGQNNLSLVRTQEFDVEPGSAEHERLRSTLAQMAEAAGLKRDFAGLSMQRLREVALNEILPCLVARFEATAPLAASAAGLVGVPAGFDVATASPAELAALWSKLGKAVGHDAGQPLPRAGEIDSLVGLFLDGPDAAAIGAEVRRPSLGRKLAEVMTESRWVTGDGLDVLAALPGDGLSFAKARELLAEENLPVATRTALLSLFEVGADGSLTASELMKACWVDNQDNEVSDAELKSLAKAMHELSLNGVDHEGMPLSLFRADMVRTIEKLRDPDSTHGDWRGLVSHLEGTTEHGREPYTQNERVVLAALFRSFGKPDSTGRIPDSESLENYIRRIPASGAFSERYRGECLYALVRPSPAERADVTLAALRDQLAQEKAGKGRSELCIAYAVQTDGSLERDPGVKFNELAWRIRCYEHDWFEDSVVADAIEDFNDANPHAKLDASNVSLGTLIKLIDSGHYQPDARTRRFIDDSRKAFDGARQALGRGRAAEAIGDDAGAARAYSEFASHDAVLADLADRYTARERQALDKRLENYATAKGVAEFVATTAVLTVATLGAGAIYGAAARAGYGLFTAMAMGAGGGTALVSGMSIAGRGLGELGVGLGGGTMDGERFALGVWNDTKTGGMAAASTVVPLGAFSWLGRVGAAGKTGLSTVATFLTQRAAGQAVLSGTLNLSLDFASHKAFATMSGEPPPDYSWARAALVFGLGSANTLATAKLAGKAGLGARSGELGFDLGASLLEAGCINQLEGRSFGDELGSQFLQQAVVSLLARKTHTDLQRSLDEQGRARQERRSQMQTPERALRRAQGSGGGADLPTRFSELKGLVSAEDFYRYSQKKGVEVSRSSRSAAGWHRPLEEHDEVAHVDGGVDSVTTPDGHRSLVHSHPGHKVPLPSGDDWRNAYGDLAALRRARAKDVADGKLDASRTNPGYYVETIVGSEGLTVFGFRKVADNAPYPKKTDANYEFLMLCRLDGYEPFLVHKRYDEKPVSDADLPGGKKLGDWVNDGGGVALGGTGKGRAQGTPKGWGDLFRLRNPSDANLHDVSVRKAGEPRGRDEIGSHEGRRAIEHRTSKDVHADGSVQYRVGIGEWARVDVRKGETVSLVSTHFQSCAAVVVRGKNAAGETVLLLSHLEADHARGQFDRLKGELESLKKDGVTDLEVVVHLDPDALASSGKRDRPWDDAFFTFPDPNDLRRALGADVAVRQVDLKRTSADGNPEVTNVYVDGERIVIEYPEAALGERYVDIPWTPPSGAVGRGKSEGSGNTGRSRADDHAPGPNRAAEPPIVELLRLRRSLDAADKFASRTAMTAADFEAMKGMGELSRAELRARQKSLLDTHPELPRTEAEWALVELAAGTANPGEAQRAGIDLLRRKDELGVLVGRKGNTDDLIAGLVAEIGTPRSADGSAGLVTAKQVSRGIDGLVVLRQRGDRRLHELFERTWSDAERALLFKAIGARHDVLAVDGGDCEAAIAELRVFADAIRGENRDLLVQNTSMDALVLQEETHKLEISGAFQAFGTSCAPTSVLTLLGNSDPIRAWEFNKDPAKFIAAQATVMRNQDVVHWPRLSDMQQAYSRDVAAFRQVDAFRQLFSHDETHGRWARMKLHIAHGNLLGALKELVGGFERAGRISYDQDAAFFALAGKRREPTEAERKHLQSLYNALGPDRLKELGVANFEGFLATIRKAEESGSVRNLEAEGTFPSKFIDSVLGASTGRRHAAVDPHGRGNAGRLETWKRLVAAVDEGPGCVIAVRWGESGMGHAMAVVDRRPAPPAGAEEIKIHDPWTGLAVWRSYDQLMGDNVAIGPDELGPATLVQVYLPTG